MSADLRPPPRRWVPRLTWWVNTTLLQVLIVAFSLLEFVDGYPAFRPISATATAAMVVTLACVLLRTKAPWVLLVVVVGLNFMYTLETPLSPPGWSLVVALPFAVYAVSSTVTVRIAIVAGILSGLLLVVTALVARGITFPNIYPTTVTAFVVSSLALGQMTYTHRKLIETSKRRALEAERTREALAATRVAEQRLATARNLHDVVGHQIALINLQAGAASRAVRGAPDEALRSLSMIETSAEQILAEIGELLKELRNVHADDHSGSRGLEAITHLSQTLTAGGLPVDLHIDRDLPTLTRHVDDALYRILEEALVNAYKHGAAGKPATARVEWDGDTVLVSVSNPVDGHPPAQASTSTKLGVVGIRERALALGGHASVAVSDGIYELSVRIPVP